MSNLKEEEISISLFIMQKLFKFLCINFFRTNTNFFIIILFQTHKLLNNVSNHQYLVAKVLYITKSSK